MAIEESKKVEILKVEKLQGSLEAHEQRLMERSMARSGDQVLQATVSKKGGYGGRSSFRNRGRGRDQRGGGFKNSQNFSQDQERSDQDRPESSNKRGTSSKWRGGRKMVDRKNLKCFNCNKIGHFSAECTTPPAQNENHGKHHEETHLAKEGTETNLEEKPLMLMMVTNHNPKDDERWYIDSGSSSHITGHNNWFVNLDETKKSTVRFADNRVIQAEGIGEVLIKRDDGSSAILSECLYVPNMKSNLISLGQLVEKKFHIDIHNGYLAIFEPVTEKMVIRTKMASNRTFQVSLRNLESQCMTAEILAEDTWLRHLRLGHLNFRDLSMLRNKEMVLGLPAIQIPSKVCDSCLISKQPRNSFSNFTPSRANDLLHIVYSDVCGPFDAPSLGGSKYFVTFIDDLTRKIWIYPIQPKSEVFSVFKNFKALVEKQSGKCIKIFRTDGVENLPQKRLRIFARTRALCMRSQPYTHHNTMELQKEGTKPF